MFCHLSEIGVQRKKTFNVYEKTPSSGEKTVLPNIVAASAIIIQLVESDRGQMRITSIN